MKPSLRHDSKNYPKFVLFIIKAKPHLRLKVAVHYQSAKPLINIR